MHVFMIGTRGCGGKQYEKSMSFTHTKRQNNIVDHVTFIGYRKHLSESNQIILLLKERGHMVQFTHFLYDNKRTYPVR